MLGVPVNVPPILTNISVNALDAVVPVPDIGILYNQSNYN